MKIAGIGFIVLGSVLLLISGLYFGVYLIFEKSPNKTDKTLGKLFDSKYKKDVAVWTGFGKYDGPPRVAFTIKNLTKTKYLYSVNNKHYFCALDFWKKPNEIPNSTWVIYFKKFPYFSYLDNDENCFGAFDFFVKASIFFGMAICTFGFGIAFLLKI